MAAFGRTAAVPNPPLPCSSSSCCVTKRQQAPPWRVPSPGCGPTPPTRTMTATPCTRAAAPPLRRQAAGCSPVWQTPAAQRRWRHWWRSSRACRRAPPPAEQAAAVETGQAGGLSYSQCCWMNSRRSGRHMGCSCTHGTALCCTAAVPCTQPVYAPAGPWWLAPGCCTGAAIRSKQISMAIPM